MRSSTNRTTQWEPATSTIVKNAVSTRNLYLTRPSHQSLAADSFSDTCSDPDSEADTDIDIELSTSEDAGITLQQESDADLDSEAKEILKDIAQARAEGPAKPNHTLKTVKLWKREGHFWRK
jgi:hypothetical protein